MIFYCGESMTQSKKIYDLPMLLIHFLYSNTNCYKEESCHIWLGETGEVSWKVLDFK